MYAIIETGGKQYRVQKGDVITIEKLEEKDGAKVTFDKVLAMGEGKDLQIGTPYLDIPVIGKVIESGKGKKVIVYKYKAKKDSRKKKGHRQPFSKVEITAIGAEEKPAENKAEKAPAKKAEKPAAKKEAPAKEDKGVSMSMKKDELMAYAEEHGIAIDKKATKQVIIDTINENK